MVFFCTGSGEGKLFARRSRGRKLWGWGGGWFAYRGGVVGGEKGRPVRGISQVDS